MKITFYDPQFEDEDNLDSKNNHDEINGIDDNNINENNIVVEEEKEIPVIKKKVVSDKSVQTTKFKNKKLTDIKNENKRNGLIELKDDIKKLKLKNINLANELISSLTNTNGDIK